MSFLKKLFGGSDKGANEAPLTREEYKGYVVIATPFAASGQFQVCGTISKMVGEGEKQHRFIRADRFASKEEAATFSLVKARQIIDQLGDRIFDS